MERQAKRSDKEIIVMILSLTYALGVGVFAVIRMVNQDWMIGILDIILASIGLFIFIYVWYTRSGHYPAYAIALISVIGTIATLAMKGSGQIYWAYPSVALVFYLLPNKHALILWGVSALIIIGLLIDLPVIELVTIAMTIGITSFFCYFFSARMNEQHDRLRRIANEDVLTQVLNRRAFNNDTIKLTDSQTAESAILFDLDKFKQVNDYFGHAKGDQVLQQVAVYVQSQLSCENCLYRIGGDEFAILCVGKDFGYAYHLAQKIHLDFSQGEINKEHDITLSMAVAQKEPDESIKDWLGRLDSALYKAKKSGRNQIIKAIRH